MRMFQRIRDGVMRLDDHERAVLEGLIMALDMFREGKRIFDKPGSLKDGEFVFLRLREPAKPIKLRIGRPGTLDAQFFVFQPKEIYMLDQTKIRILWGKQPFQQLLKSDLVELWIGDYNALIQRQHAEPRTGYDPAEQLGRSRRFHR